eukprot:m.164496 g.164496  ORF g.164496 m.164496 type:complete len:127 (-) comp12432_c0_seq1:285-665(-)
MAFRIARALRTVQAAKSEGFLDSFSEAYIKWSGYRTFGLRAEDLVMEELPGVREALRRMPDEYQDERYFRFKRAMLASAKQTPLPKDLHTAPEEDTQELINMIRLVRQELEERSAYDSGEVSSQLK